MGQNNLLGKADDRQRCDQFRLSQFTTGHMQTCTTTSLPYQITIINKNRTLHNFLENVSLLFSSQQMTKFSRTPITSYRCKLCQFCILYCIRGDF
jgi:hypothetical protein